MTAHTYGEPPERKIVRRKCRWCGGVFKVPQDYPKRTGCPDCQPQLFDPREMVEERDED
jgi:uncharacterized OB-fold protein